jgi:hypothetical protein
VLQEYHYNTSRNISGFGDDERVHHYLSRPGRLEINESADGTTVTEGIVLADIVVVPLMLERTPAPNLAGRG